MGIGTLFLQPKGVQSKFKARFYPLKLHLGCDVHHSEWLQTRFDHLQFCNGGRNLTHAASVAVERDPDLVLRSTMPESLNNCGGWLSNQGTSNDLVDVA